MPPASPEPLDYASTRSSRKPRHEPLLVLVSWLYPLIVPAALYATWLVAWLILGHPPRPSLDDPGQISRLVDVFFAIAGLLLISWPLAFPILAAGMVLTPKWAYEHKWPVAISVLLVAALFLLYIGSFLLLQWDPLDVLYWYMD